MAEARAYAMRNREGSNWFGHENTNATAASSPAKAAPVSPPPAKNGTDTPAGRTQMIKPTCNSNQWFKYDGAAASSPKKETPKASKQPTGDWCAHDTPSADDKKESKPRVMTTEGESYCRRDKAGSSAAWFSHEHGKGSEPQGGAGPRVTSKEGCGNATRMRGESENWFNHDASGGAAKEPAHMSKGRGVKPRSSEMHHVFHHAEDAGK